MCCSPWLTWYAKSHPPSVSLPEHTEASLPRNKPVPASTPAGVRLASRYREPLEDMLAVSLVNNLLHVATPAIMKRGRKETFPGVLNHLGVQKRVLDEALGGAGFGGYGSYLSGFDIILQ